LVYYRWMNVRGLGVGLPVLANPMGWDPEDWLLGGLAFRAWAWGYIPVLVDPMGWHPEDWLLGGRAFRAWAWAIYPY